MSSDLWRAVAQQRERTRALAEQDAAAWRQAAERLERQRDKTAAVNRELNAQLMEAERRHIRPWLAMLKDADDTANQLVSIALAHHTNHQATLDTARRLAPFVSPLVAGKAERSRGYSTRSFTPAYVKPKHVVEPSKAMKRRAGERLTEIGRAHV